MSSYNDFIKEAAEHGRSILLYALPSDERIHPVESDVSAVFIRDFETDKTIYLSFGHPDLPQTVDKETFCKDMEGLKNRKWVFDKKAFFQKFNIANLLDINLYKHLWEGVTYEKTKFETVAHRFINRGKNGAGKLNNVIPILKHKEMFVNLSNTIYEETSLESNVGNGYLKENEVIIETLADIESHGVYVNPECFKSHFDVPIGPNNLVYSQYNIYTSTGRPSNHFNNINYAALNKDNGVRKCFTSRFGEDGKIVLIDYSAFHPRIISHLVKFPLPLETDIYRYLGEMYFKRELSDYDMDEAKKLTFRQLYGGVEEQYEHIKYFAKLKEFIDNNWQEFKLKGSVLTPLFKRMITDRHVKEPTPSKLFNYILQATETEVAIPALKVVNKYLIDNGKRSKPVLYTYDSILFDFHKNDGADTLATVVALMKMQNRFPIKAYAGDSYASVVQIYA